MDLDANVGAARIAGQPAPKFTVLLPTHNRADVLGFAIRSVLSQTCHDFELLVVGDGCTDKTAEVVRAFDDPRIRFFDLPKAPFFGYANRNVALREARGTYVAFAAHDDLLFPDHLERLGAMLDSSGAAIAYSRPVWVSTDGIAVPLYSDITFPDTLADFQKGNSIPASCFVHRRALFDEVGYWPEDVRAGADWVLWQRIIAHSGRIEHLPIATSLHFSANWHKSRHADFPPFSHALGYAETCGWWPETLRRPPVPGVPEQKAYADVMAVGAREWEDLRRSLDKAASRLSWEMLSRTLPEKATLGANLAAVRSRLLKNQIRRLAARLRSMLQG